jgi:hypothetical protein
LGDVGVAERIHLEIPKVGSGEIGDGVGVGRLRVAAEVGNRPPEQVGVEADDDSFLPPLGGQQLAAEPLLERVDAPVVPVKDQVDESVAGRQNPLPFQRAGKHPLAQPVVVRRILQVEPLHT